MPEVQLRETELAELRRILRTSMTDYKALEDGAFKSPGQVVSECLEHFSAMAEAFYRTPLDCQELRIIELEEELLALRGPRPATDKDAGEEPSDAGNGGGVELRFYESHH